MKREKEKYSIQAVENALNVLEQFQGKKAELGITELSQNLGLHKNNIFRLLATLENRGYIEQNKINEHYRLGIKSLELGRAFLSHTGLIKVAVQKLEELSNKVNETVYLSIMKKQQVLFIEDWEAKRALRVASRIGERLSPLCTATGKVFLAYASEEQRKSIIDANEFIKYTDNTIMTEEEYVKELAEVEKNGYAIDNQEKDLGVICIAGPIFNYNNDVVASISISGPSIRLTGESIKNFYVKNVVEYCQKVSTAIGYSG
jgi:DNA-binding IclR family transcriptional regulator